MNVKRFLHTAINLVVAAMMVVTAMGLQAQVAPSSVRAGEAWDCSSYNFWVERYGKVWVHNDSNNNEPPQKATVYINEANVKTFDVPAMAKHGVPVLLGNVSTPGDAGFSWKVKGTVDCSDSGSYPPIPTASPTPTATATATATATSTSTSTATETATLTATPTATETATPTQTATLTATATSTSTETASPTPTETTTPTEEPTTTPTETPTEPPTECIVTDLKGRFDHNGDHMSGNPAKGFLSNLSDDPECPDTLWVHIFGSNQEPESDGWLESQSYVISYSYQVPPGTQDMEIWAEVPDAGYCWYQVDLVDTAEVKRPPYYITWDYVFVQGDECGDGDGKPPKPVCPTCGPHVDEFVPNGLSISWVSVTPCEITWCAEEWRWNLGLTPVVRMISDGHPFSILDKGVFIPATEVTGGGKTYYVLDEPDPMGKWSIWYGLIEGKWDPAKYNAGEYLRFRDVAGQSSVKKFSACGITPGYWDAPNGVAQFKPGHNASEWAVFARDNYNLSWDDATTWANQLRSEGQLALPVAGS